MIVDTVTGEILDLSPLAHKPKGRPTKRTTSPYTKRPNYAQKQLQETIVLVSVIAVIVGFLAIVH